MFRLILFDIDGTLIRTGGAGVRAFGSVFEEAFGHPTGTEGIHFAGRTDSSLVREMLVNHGLEPSRENFDKFFDRYAHWLRHWLGKLPGALCVGVEGFMRHCVERSNPPVVGLLTGNVRLGAEIKLRHFGLWEQFALGAFGDDHEDRNELAAIAWSRGRERLGAGLRAEEILVVGDTPRDVACGRHIGAKVLAVTTGGATRDELAASNPDWLVADLTELQW
jgi:phosphoglycolate phosphatase